MHKITGEIKCKASQAMAWPNAEWITYYTDFIEFKIKMKILFVIGILFIYFIIRPVLIKCSSFDYEYNIFCGRLLITWTPLVRTRVGLVREIVALVRPCTYRTPTKPQSDIVIEDPRRRISNRLNVHNITITRRVCNLLYYYNIADNTPATRL